MFCAYLERWNLTVDGFTCRARMPHSRSRPSQRQSWLVDMQAHAYRDRSAEQRHRRTGSAEQTAMIDNANIWPRRGRRLARHSAIAAKTGSPQRGSDIDHDETATP
jgi:hypothetical protein